MPNAVIKSQAKDSTEYTETQRYRKDGLMKRGLASFSPVFSPTLFSPSKILTFLLIPLLLGSCSSHEGDRLVRKYVQAAESNSSTKSQLSNDLVSSCSNLVDAAIMTEMDNLNWSVSTRRSLVELMRRRLSTNLACVIQS